LPTFFPAKELAFLLNANVVPFAVQIWVEIANCFSNLFWQEYLKNQYFNAYLKPSQKLGFQSQEDNRVNQRLWPLHSKLKRQFPQSPSRPRSIFIFMTYSDIIVHSLRLCREIVITSFFSIRSH
jgi:hypothetical protein